MKAIKTLCFVALAGLFAACEGGDACKNVTLGCMTDSLSYASGIRVSSGVRGMAYSEMQVDSTTIDAFVAGLRAAFPVKATPKAKAYAYGMSLGASAIDMYEEVKEDFKSQGVDTLDAALFLEGVVASLYESDRVMDAALATEYFNKKKYLEESDKFMQRNSERKGVVTLPSGLQYKLGKEGHGALAAANDTVVCVYKGTLPDGRVVDTSVGEAVKLPASGVIDGLKEAFALFPAGTVCTLYIPWDLGFGPHGADGVPPYSSLVFELEIVDVVRKR